MIAIAAVFYLVDWLRSLAWLAVMSMRIDLYCQPSGTVAVCAECWQKFLAEDMASGLMPVGIHCVEFGVAVRLTTSAARVFRVIEARSTRRRRLPAERKCA